MRYYHITIIVISEIISYHYHSNKWDSEIISYHYHSNKWDNIISLSSSSQASAASSCPWWCSWSALLLWSRSTKLVEIFWRDNYRKLGKGNNIMKTSLISFDFWNVWLNNISLFYLYEQNLNSEFPINLYNGMKLMFYLNKVQIIVFHSNISISWLFCIRIISYSNYKCL